MYPKNVKMAEPIGPNFFVGPRVTPRKVYGLSNFQNFASIKILFCKILKIHEIFVLFLFYNVYKENMFTIEIEDGREAP